MHLVPPEVVTKSGPFPAHVERARAEADQQRRRKRILFAQKAPFEQFIGGRSPPAEIIHTASILASDTGRVDTLESR